MIKLNKRLAQSTQSYGEECVFLCTEGCVPQGENTLFQLSPPFSAMAGADWVLRPNMAQRRASHLGRFSPLRALALDFDFKKQSSFPTGKKKIMLWHHKENKNKQNLYGIKMSQKLKCFLQLLPMTEVPSSMKQNMQC